MMGLFNLRGISGQIAALVVVSIAALHLIITAGFLLHRPDQADPSFDRGHGQLAAAIQDNLNRQILMQENQANGYDLCRQGGDYEKCAKRQTSEAVGARNDQATMARNNALIHRLQNAFMKIRNGLGQYGLGQYGLGQYGLRYTWFKVRTTNNIDSL